MASTVQAFFKKHLQSLIASTIFPSERDDWYVKQGYSNESVRQKEWRIPFETFLKAQRQLENEYYDLFHQIALSQSFIPCRTIAGEHCFLERISFKPLINPEHVTQVLPATNKHIIYFTGMGSCYQGCFKDICMAAKSTGATIHAFNYPGLKLHGGTIREAKDLINSGIAMVNQLIKEGVKVDDIILQGDSFGAAVALEVKQQFKKQAAINIRVICNNTFDTFEAAVKDAISNSYLPNVLQYGVEPILQLTGWDIRPGDKYLADTPYQCHIQHIGDLTLPCSDLASRVSSNSRQENFKDPCPPSYLEARDLIASHNWARIKHNLIHHFQKKYGARSISEVDAHFVDLCDMELLDGGDVYRDFVNNFLTASQLYIDLHLQKLSASSLPGLLTSNGAKQLSTHFFKYKDEQAYKKPYEVRQESTQDKLILWVNNS